MTGGGNALTAFEALPLAVAMRDLMWLGASVRIVHIIGFVTLVGSVIVFDLRVLGLSKDISVAALTRHTLPWTLGALFVVVPTGLMMFTAHAADLVSNRAFVLKMTLLMAAASNGLWFQLGPYQGVKAWDMGVAAPAAAKISAALSIAIWLGVIGCGTLLTYK